MVVLKKVKTDYITCSGCDFNVEKCNPVLLRCEQNIYKKIDVKNVVVIDGIAYGLREECEKGLCEDLTCMNCEYFYRCYKKLGKVVHHVNNNK